MGGKPIAMKCSRYGAEGVRVGQTNLESWHSVRRRLRPHRVPGSDAECLSCFAPNPERTKASK